MKKAVVSLTKSVIFFDRPPLRCIICMKSGKMAFSKNGSSGKIIPSWLCVRRMLTSIREETKKGTGVCINSKTSTVHHATLCRDAKRYYVLSTPPLSLPIGGGIPRRIFCLT